MAGRGAGRSLVAVEHLRRAVVTDGDLQGGAAQLSVAGVGRAYHEQHTRGQVDHHAHIHVATVADGHHGQVAVQAFIGHLRRQIGQVVNAASATVAAGAAARQADRAQVVLEYDEGSTDLADGQGICSQLRNHFAPADGRMLAANLADPGNDLLLRWARRP